MARSRMRLVSSEVNNMFPYRPSAYEADSVFGQSQSVELVATGSGITLRMSH